MTKYIFILLTSILLTSCVDKNSTAAKDQNINTNKVDRLFRDTVEGTVTILFDNKYIFKIGIDTTLKPDTYIAWTAGFYKSNGDTIYTYFPADTTKEFKQIKTKYFLAETVQGTTMLNINGNANKLIDSLLNMKCENCGEVVSIYGKAKAIVTKDKITFIP